jgi:hypothetical protein
MAIDKPPYAMPHTHLSCTQQLIADSSLVEFILPICKESKQAYCAYAHSARAVCYCATKRSSAFPPNIPAGLRGRTSRLGGFTPSSV